MFAVVSLEIFGFEAVSQLFKGAAGAFGLRLAEFFAGPYRQLMVLIKELCIL